jgi:hypothetical protein
MIEPVYVPDELYRAATTRCGLDPRRYGIYRDTSVTLGDKRPSNCTAKDWAAGFAVYSAIPISHSLQFTITRTESSWSAVPQ